MILVPSLVGPGNRAGTHFKYAANLKADICLDLNPRVLVGTKYIAGTHSEAGTNLKAGTSFEGGTRILAGTRFEVGTNLLSI